MADQEKERRLLRRFQAGDNEALGDLIEMHRGFIWSVIRDVAKYKKLLRNLEYDDLFQIAVLGFRRACQKFDLSRKTCLLSYAQWWIRAFCQDEQWRQCHCVTINRHTSGKREARLVRDVELDGAPRPAGGKADDSPCFPHSINQLDRIMFLYLGPGQSPDERVLNRLAVEQAIASLDERSAAMVARRFGLHGKPEENLQQIGDDFGITRERTRQIIDKALDQMRRFLGSRRAELRLESRRAMECQSRHTIA